MPKSAVGCFADRIIHMERILLVTRVLIGAGTLRHRARTMTFKGLLPCFLIGPLPAHSLVNKRYVAFLMPMPADRRNRLSLLNYRINDAKCRAAISLHCGFGTNGPTAGISGVFGYSCPS
jgi:hypothetical protein